jgi:hypothetical protein
VPTQCEAVTVTTSQLFLQSVSNIPESIILCEKDTFYCKTGSEMYRAGDLGIKLQETTKKILIVVISIYYVSYTAA